MSIRSHPRTGNTPTSGPSGTIDFKNEFVNSSAALAAKNDETVSHIMERLEQLSSKISNQPEAPASRPMMSARASSTTTPTTNTVNHHDLHSRLSVLENIHEDTLERLGSKLETVERKLSDNKEAEVLMGQISSKFAGLQSQLNSSRDNDALIGKIANKFSAVEGKLQSAMQLHDRVSGLESRLDSHSDLHSRLTRLESKMDRSDVHSRVSRLEAQMEPDPEHERILTRINSKLDQLESSRRNPLGSEMKRLEPLPHNSRSARSSSMERSHLGAQYTKENDFLGAEADREQRIQYLQTRIEKLKELRGKYENEDVLR